MARVGAAPAKFRRQRRRRGQVNYIVIGQFLAMQLLEIIRKTAIKAAR